MRAVIISRTAQMYTKKGKVLVDYVALSLICHMLLTFHLLAQTCKNGLSCTVRSHQKAVMCI